MRIFRPGEQRKYAASGSTNDLQSGFTPAALARTFGPAKCQHVGHEPVSREPVIDGVHVYTCSCGERVQINERRVRRMMRNFTMFDFSWAFSQISASPDALASAVKYHAAMYFAALFPADDSEQKGLDVDGYAIKRLVVDADAMEGSEDLRSTCEAFGLPWVRRHRVIDKAKFSHASLGEHGFGIGGKVIEDHMTVELMRGDIHHSRTGTRIIFGAQTGAGHYTSMTEVIEALKESGIGEHTTVAPEEQRKMLEVALCDYVERVEGYEVPDWLTSAVPGPIAQCVMAAAYYDAHFDEALKTFVDWCRANGKRIEEPETGIIVTGSSTREVDFSKATLIGDDRRGSGE